MLIGDVLEIDGEVDIATGHYVLHLECIELNWISELLNDSSKLPGGDLGALLILAPSADNFPRGKNEGRGFGFAQSHDHSCESPGVVLGVSGVKSDVFEFELAVEIDRCDDVLDFRPLNIIFENLLLQFALGD